MRKHLACAALAVAVAAPLPAQTAAAPKIRIDYTQEVLPNGLTVLYSLDRSTPVVAVEVMYNVGSKHEQVGRTGFAHLFEHVMFKGSRNVADGEHWSLLEKVGGRAGSDINGTTWTDRTNYFEQVPSNYLELALWLESDRMGTLTETLTKDKLDNQREVVKNERRQSVDNQPYGSWFEKMFWYAFPDNHPYRHAVIGSMEDLMPHRSMTSSTSSRLTTHRTTRCSSLPEISIWRRRSHSFANTSAIFRADQRFLHFAA